MGDSQEHNGTEADLLCPGYIEHHVFQHTKDVEGRNFRHRGSRGCERRAMNVHTCDLVFTFSADDRSNVFFMRSTQCGGSMRPCVAPQSLAVLFWRSSVENHPTRDRARLLMRQHACKSNFARRKPLY